MTEREQRKYAVTLDDLESSAHVPAELQKTAKADPPPPELVSEDVMERTRLIRLAGA
ncbi:MAG TPA: hypothetical protein VEZ46_05570 [Mycobacteriales bacterium]|jgi:hypothetical protein|nr:hypothetical protein [Mycobacteriales bacterium]